MLHSVLTRHKSMYFVHGEAPISWIAAVHPICHWSDIPRLGEGKQKSSRLFLEEPERHLPLGETYLLVAFMDNMDDRCQVSQTSSIWLEFKCNVSFLTSVNVLFKVSYLLCCSSIGILPSLCIFPSIVYVFCSRVSGLTGFLFLPVTVWMQKPVRKWTGLGSLEVWGEKSEFGGEWGWMKNKCYAEEGWQLGEARASFKQKEFKVWDWC